MGPRLLAALLCLVLQGCAAWTLASVGTLAVSDRTGSDHALGWAINRDCKALRIMDAELPCRDLLETYNQHPF